MEDEYEIPVDFREENHPPGYNATTNMSSSVASSSRMASAASAPVNLGNRRNATSGRNSANADQRFRGNFSELQRNRNDATTTGTTTPPDGNSFHSSPMWNSSTPQRMKSRRELEQKIRHRNDARNIRHRAAMSGFSQKFNAPDDGNRKSDSNEDATPALLPLPKALTDLLLQTAILGIGTTAKLSKPTLELTKNTLLPQIIIPLLQEVWQQYVPIRLQTWMNVVPTSLKNVGNLLWDTEAGQALGEKAGQLGENVVDMASSEVARQCWIDATVALIKLMESLHTPEVKALLDQFAVGACRFVDVLSSGKAKQVWFDASDALWALIEVGSDPVMVVSLAEGCAQICFALEHERDSLKERRSKDSAAGGGSVSEKMQKLLAAKRRRERDRRQTGTYPPGKTVVGEREGRDGFEDALLDGLNGYIDTKEENEGEFEDQIYDNIDNIAEDDGPPQRVIVPANSSENIDTLFPKNIDDAGNSRDEGFDTNVVNDDSESEITTEIEDLRCGKDVIDDDDVHTQSSESERSSISRKGNALAYEQDGNVDNTASFHNQIDQLELHPNDDGTASEMYDTFDEPILQFYRRLNEVLVETRKQGKSHLEYSARGDRFSKEDGKIEINENATSDTARRGGTVPSTTKPLVFGRPFGVPKKWWKFIIIASIFGVASMCMLWFALGCYGFYALFIGGGRVYHAPSSMNRMQQQPSNIVIQIVTSKQQEVVNESDASTSKESCRSKSGGRVTSITLDDWNEMKLGVDKVIEQTTRKQ